MHKIDFFQNPARLFTAWAIAVVFCLVPISHAFAAVSPSTPSSPISAALSSSAANTNPDAPVQSQPTPPPTLDPTQFNPITSTTLPLENGHRIVMRVNSRPITWEELIAQTHIAGAAIYAQFPDKEANIAAALEAPLRDELIIQSLYNGFAEEHHLKPEVREVQEGIGKLIEKADPQMAQALKNLSPDQIKTLVQDALMRQKVDKYIGDRATSNTPTQADLTSFTAKFQPTTSSITILRARHIVIRATPDMTEFNINDAQAKAEEIRAKIRDDKSTAPAAGSSPVDFITAARQYSQDRFTAYLGGDLGYFPAGSMYPPINEALEKLQPGEISPVVRTKVGFHILQLTDRRDDNLVTHYDHWRRVDAVRQWLKVAYNEAHVESYLNQ